MPPQPLKTPFLSTPNMVTILFRAVLELLGKPQEHIEASMKEYLQHLKQDKRFKVQHEQLADVKKQEDQDLWATFAELEVKTEELQNLTVFCLDYMPSLIEIMEPAQLTITDIQFSEFLNDLQTKLHQIDILAKHVKIENDHLKRNLGGLLNNYIQVLLKQNNLSAAQLSQLIGAPQDQLEDYLDQMMDAGKIDLKEGIYFLKEKSKMNE